MNHWSTKFDLFLLRWGTSLTCVTYARCQQTRRRRLRRRTTWVSLKPLRWTPPTWRLPSTIFSQVTPGFFLQSTAFPILSLPMTKNTWVCCGWLLIKIIGRNFVPDLQSFWLCVPNTQPHLFTCQKSIGLCPKSLPCLPGRRTWSGRPTWRRSMWSPLSTRRLWGGNAAAHRC